MSDIKKQINNLLKASTLQQYKRIGTYEKEIILLYKSALTDIQNKLSKLYASNIDPISLPIQQLQKLAGDIETILVKSGVKNIKSTTQAITGVFRTSYGATGSAFNKVLKTNIQFGLLDPNVVNASVINPYGLIKWPNLTATQISRNVIKIRNEVTSGIIQGKSYNEIIKFISNELNITTGKALKIVRTETHRAINEARLLSLSEVDKAGNNLGLTISRVWNCSFINSRDSHQQMDGAIADADGNFTLPSGITTEAPGLSGDAGEDVNCSCYITTDIEGI